VKVIEYYTNNKFFLIITGGVLAFLSFMLSFFGVNDDHIYYYYYIISYFLLIAILGINFDKRKTIVAATVISALHLAYAFNFYPDITSSVYIGSLIFNVFIVGIFYLTGFLMNYFREGFKIEIKNREDEISNLKREMKKIKTSSHKKSNIANEIMLEKRLSRMNSYIQIEDELIKAILDKRDDFDIFLVSLLQTRLKTGSGKLYKYSKTGLWEKEYEQGSKNSVLNEEKLQQFLNAIASEGVPISNYSELCFKYKLELGTESGIIGIPVFQGNIVLSIIVLEDFRDNDISDDEKFCLRLCTSLRHRNQ